MLARRRMSGRAAARHLGWKTDYMWRRLDGRTAFDVNDLAALAGLLDVPVTTFFQGIRQGTTSELSLRGHKNRLLTSMFVTSPLQDTLPVACRAA